ncbi:MAG TPA: hypothetical protein VL463_16230 [Kofleriaceae bacterium]|jgi:hypothetical protein|nr:hypothetical protein [Kofleriaceae bacterium]
MSTGPRARAHVHTIARVLEAEETDPSWDDDKTRPGDPHDLAALASATLASGAHLPIAPPAAPAPMRVATEHTEMVRVAPRDPRRAMIAIAAASAIAGLAIGLLARGGGGRAAATSLRAPIIVRTQAAAPAPAPCPAIAPAAPPALGTFEKLERASRR